MQRPLATLGALLALTIRPASPTRIARAAQRTPMWVAYVAGSAAVAVIAGAILGPIGGVIAEPYASIAAYLRHTIGSAVRAAALIVAISLAVGALAAIGRLTIGRPSRANADVTTWFGPLPHLGICMLTFIPLIIPALLYGGASFVVGIDDALWAPPPALAWTGLLAPALCLIVLAAPLYYVALAGAALQRLAQLESSTRCIHCGYPTRGLPAPRCPECGRDPAADLE